MTTLQQIARHFEILRPSPKPEINDDDLVSQVIGSDHAAFEKIMRRYNQRLFRLARGFLKDDDEAMDVVQEAYVSAYTRLNQYKGPNKFSAWLGQIVRHEALMRIRKQQKVQYMARDDLDSCIDKTQLGNTDTPDKNMANRQLAKLIEASIDRLPDDFRIVFMMRGVEQLSIQETADLIGIRPETVKTRYHRARKLLQQRLTRHMEKEEINAFQFAGHRCDWIVETVMKRIRLI